VLVVNGGTRTWDVTDVVERPIEEPTDARESKRVLRLHSKPSVSGLELVSYGEHYETSLHALESPDWTEDGQVFDVDEIEILKQRVP